MFSFTKYSIIYLGLLLFCRISNTKAQNIEVLFSGIKSTQGQIVVKIFTDDKGFQDDKAFRTVKFKKAAIINGEMLAKLNLEPGVYGFALLDDENNNNEMEYNFFGMPDEGFGFSNFYLSGLKRPKFEQFKFLLGKNQKLKIQMKIRYM